MIYCVEDDDNIRELVIYTLETTGLKAKGFAEGTAFMEALAFDTPELILLDIMLPGEDGLELLKKLKNSAKTKDIPVIMVTAKGAEYDKVIGLDSGADDYVTKPFGMMELVSRIKAVLRRSGRVQEQDMLSVNGVSVDVKKHEVKVAGEIVTLTLKEFELLERLMRNTFLINCFRHKLKILGNSQSDCEKGSYKSSQPESFSHNSFLSVCFMLLNIHSSHLTLM